MPKNLNVYVDADWMTITVNLPECVKGYVTKAARKRAIERATEAIVAALPQNVQVFIDGPDNEPATVCVDTWGIEDDAEFRVE